MAGEEPKVEESSDPAWVPYLRALCVVAIVLLAALDTQNPETSIPSLVYAAIVGLGLGVGPSSVSKLLSGAAKAVSE